jgi:hypothetical protein
MRWQRGTRFLVVLSSLILASGRVGPQAEQKHPIYVGARICATCHEGPGMGHQFSLWLLSKHARAYASLATPEAREMARLSGIPGEPQQTPVCLGCHATASEAEDWEKDPTFRIEDGVQCERCHGAGSEYMAEEIMRDRQAATRAGLRMLSPRECRLCHYEKGSHVAVHHRPQLDVEQGRQVIAHPTPDDASVESLPEPELVDPQATGRAYVGVQACAACHKGPEMGYQFSFWRRSAHARAYGVLATPSVVMSREPVTRARPS